MSASLIGRFGSSAFRLSIAPVSMSLAGSCFSSESAPRPSIMGFENEAEQSKGRSCRQTDGSSAACHRCPFFCSALNTPLIRWTSRSVALPCLLCAVTRSHCAASSADWISSNFVCTGTPLRSVCSTTQLCSTAACNIFTFSGGTLASGSRRT